MLDSRLTPSPLLPLCAQCGTVVQRIETARDDARRRLVIIAFCHGRSEMSEVTYEYLEAAERVALTPAFGPKVTPG